MKEVLSILKENADNIQSYTINEAGNHVSLNQNGGHDVSSSLDIFSNSPESRLNGISSIFITWIGKATTARKAITNLEGIKLTSIDTTGQNPQDIITPA